MKLLTKDFLDRLHEVSDINKHVLALFLVASEFDLDDYKARFAVLFCNQYLRGLTEEEKITLSLAETSMMKGLEKCFGKAIVQEINKCL